MSYGTLVKTADISDADSVVSIGHHTDAIFIHNKDTSTPATVKLNGHYTVYIPATPATTAGVYHKIPGDYTTIEVTSNTNIAFYAVG